MFRTQLALDDEWRTRKEALSTNPSWETITKRGIETMEKEQAGFNLEKSGK